MLNPAPPSLKFAIAMSRKEPITITKSNAFQGSRKYSYKNTHKELIYDMSNLRNISIILLDNSYRNWYEYHSFHLWSISSHFKDKLRCKEHGEYQVHNIQEVGVHLKQIVGHEQIS